jgi:glyoxylase-like metal-dependent hydrolase (beta-lactamase superfamily II)
MQVSVSAAAVARSVDDGSIHWVADDVGYQRLLIVNVAYLVTDNGGWVLVDAGVRGAAPLIEKAARARFGDIPPKAIVLTHGHFDHVGGLPVLAETWRVPVYAHPAEFPFLEGMRRYPPADPAAGGGLMSLLSPLYSRGPIDLRPYLRPLAADGTVPFLPDWHWVETPGHSPGHISLWRSRGSALLSGDAVISTQQESAYSVLMQQPELHGPPMYFTPDWQSAQASTQRLADLGPNLLVTGHGPALAGEEMQQALRTLAQHFQEIAIPESHRVAGAHSAPHAG